MNIYALNGTNAVGPMQGTNDVEPAQGTNAVGPIQGRFVPEWMHMAYHAADPLMQGTNAVGPMQGISTADVVPIQGERGTYYVSPLALMHPDEVPLDGIPDDYDDDDVEAYRLAFVYGDPDALQGLFSKLKEKRKARKDARAGRKAARAARRDERRAQRARRREARTLKAERGESFFDRVGGALKNVSEGLKNKLTAEAALDEEGLDYDENILEQRSALAADGGEPGGSGGLAAWWNGMSTGQKAGLGLGAAALAYLGYKAWSSSQGGRKRSK